jgi:hypothetical protein
MRDADKTKSQLTKELTGLREKLSKLKAEEAIYINNKCAELIGLSPEEDLNFDWVPLEKLYLLPGSTAKCC